jgi:WD40 repeat protein
MQSSPAESKVNPDIARRLLITVHGIRTFGDWQEKLGRKVCEEFGSDIEVRSYRYRFFTFLAYLVPFTRWLARRQFRFDLLHELGRRDWERVDIIAHSFGTHLVGWTLLRDMKEAKPPIHTVVFSGSVLRSSFPVRELIGDSVRRIVNDCGVKDTALVVNQMFVLLTGMAGRVGFVGMEGDTFRNRYFSFGHGGYFRDCAPPKPDFIDRYWMPLLHSESGISEHDERSRTGPHDITTLFLNAAEPIKLLLYVLPFAIAFIYVNSLRLAAKSEATTALARQLAAESSLLQKSGSNPELVTLLATESMERLPELANDEQIRDTTKLMTRQVWSADEGSAIYSVAYSPNGREVAIGTRDGAVRVLDASSGKNIWRFKGNMAVTAVTFSPNSQYLGAATLANGVHAFEVANGTQLPRPSYEPGSAIVVAFSPNSRFIAVGTDTDVQVIEASTGKELSHLPHKRPVEAVTFSPNGQYVATASHDNTACVFEVATGKKKREFRFSNNVFAVAFSPDGRYIAAGGEDNTAAVFELSTGKKVLHRDFGNEVTQVSFSRDSRYLAIAIKDESARVIKIPEGNEISHLSSPVGGALEFSPDGRYLAFGNSVFELAISKEISRHIGARGPSAISPDWQYIASGGRDGKIRLFEIFRTIGTSVAESATSNESVISKAEPNAIEAVSNINHLGFRFLAAVSPDVRYVATANLNHTLQVFDARSGKAISKLNNSNIVTSMAFSPDDKYVVIGSFDNGPTPAAAHGLLSIFETLTGSEQQSFTYRGVIQAIALSPDGQYIVVGTTDGSDRSGDINGSVRLFERSENQEKWHFTLGVVDSIAFSPNGRYLAIGGLNGMARVLDVRSGRGLSSLTSQGIVEAVTFSPDSKYVAVISTNKTANVFEASTGREIARITLDELPSMGNEMRKAIRFGQDGRYLYTTGGGITEPVTVARHLLQPHDLIEVACSLVTRNLTKDEWDEYVGRDILYHRTCQNRKRLVFPSGHGIDGG